MSKNKNKKPNMLLLDGTVLHKLF